VLFSAERAWSQSASLKEEEIYQKKRHHIARRLVKAVRHAETLVALLQTSGADSQTQLEARAYRATLAGQSAFESKRWDVALREYSIAKVILDVLLSKADEASRSVYKDASTTVDPSLRYCGYQLQTGSQGDILTLAQANLSREPALIELLQDINPAALQSRRDSSAPAGIRAIQWRSRTAPLDNPEIVVALLKVQDTQTTFDERNNSSDLSATEKAAAMDEILNAWAEAEDATRRVIDEGAGMRAQDKEQALQIILTYVSFHFVATRVQRDVLLIKDLEKKKGAKLPVLKDLVKLHDSIIQVSQVVRLF
jgi:signal recognition particle subunit SRP68